MPKTPITIEKLAAATDFDNLVEIKDITVTKQCSYLKISIGGVKNGAFVLENVECLGVRDIDSDEVKEACGGNAPKKNKLSLLLPKDSELLKAFENLEEGFKITAKNFGSKVAIIKALKNKNKKAILKDSDLAGDVAEHLVGFPDWDTMRDDEKLPLERWPKHLREGKITAVSCDRKIGQIFKNSTYDNKQTGQSEESNILSVEVDFTGWPSTPNEPKSVLKDATKNQIFYRHGGKKIIVDPQDVETQEKYDQFIKDKGIDEIKVDFDLLTTKDGKLPTRENLHEIISRRAKIERIVISVEQVSCSQVGIHPKLRVEEAVIRPEYQGDNNALSCSHVFKPSAKIADPFEAEKTSDMPAKQVEAPAETPAPAKQVEAPDQ